MKLEFDPAACDGFGYCAEILPEMISLDEWGFPIVSDEEIPDDLQRVATRAVTFCPRRAIRFRPDGRRTSGGRARSS
jgi:ferredoxin